MSSSSCPGHSLVNRAAASAPASSHAGQPPLHPPHVCSYKGQSPGMKPVACACGRLPSTACHALCVRTSLNSSRCGDTGTGGRWVITSGAQGRCMHASVGQQGRHRTRPRQPPKKRGQLPRLHTRDPRSLGAIQHAGGQQRNHRRPGCMRVGWHLLAHASALHTCIHQCCGARSCPCDRHRSSAHSTCGHGHARPRAS